MGKVQSVGHKRLSGGELVVRTSQERYGIEEELRRLREEERLEEQREAAQQETEEENRSVGKKG